MQYDEFIKLVRERSEMAGRGDTENAIKSVFQTLRDRIVTQTWENVQSQLPHEFQQAMTMGFMEKMSDTVSGPTRMDLKSFIMRVADRLQTTDYNQAEKVTRAVFITLRQATTPGAQEEIERELPEDIREFWRQSQPPQMVQEASEARTQTQEQPYEMEAPVIVGEEVCTVCGEVIVPPSTAEMTTQEGWHKHDVGEGAQPIETESMLGKEQEHVAHPPAEERVDVIPPMGAKDTNAGPGSETHYRSDPQLEQEIRQMLDENHEIESGDIDVMVMAGNVTLRGQVPSQGQREEAGKIAAKALGVGEILNEITVEQRDVGENI